IEELVTPLPRPGIAQCCLSEHLGYAISWELVVPQKNVGCPWKTAAAGGRLWGETLEISETCPPQWPLLAAPEQAYGGESGIAAAIVAADPSGPPRRGACRPKSLPAILSNPLVYFVGSNPDAHAPDSAALGQYPSSILSGGESGIAAAI